MGISPGVKNAGSAVAKPSRAGAGEKRWQRKTASVLGPGEVAARAAALKTGGRSGRGSGDRGEGRERSRAAPAAAAPTTGAGRATGGGLSPLLPGSCIPPPPPPHQPRRHRHRSPCPRGSGSSGSAPLRSVPFLSGPRPGGRVAVPAPAGRCPRSRPAAPSAAGRRAARRHRLPLEGGEGGAGAGAAEGGRRPPAAFPPPPPRSAGLSGKGGGEARRGGAERRVEESRGPGLPGGPTGTGHRGTGRGWTGADRQGRPAAACREEGEGESATYFEESGCCPEGPASDRNGGNFYCA